MSRPNTALSREALRNTGQISIFRSEKASSQGRLLEICAKVSGRGTLRVKRRVKLQIEGGGHSKEEAGPEKQYKKAKL